MQIKTELRQATDGKCWHLYVNGAPAVTWESYQVCCNVEAALREAESRGYYSEGAEVADVIRRQLARA